MTLRILAVEDSPTQAAALRAELERGGHEVVEARNGQHALSLLDSASVDVVLSDIVMPGDVDGYELCRRVKREHPDLPVILLTSLSDPLDIIRGLEAGADNFLTKPYTPEHLLERIGVLMATRRSRSRGRVQAGIMVQFMDRQFIITSEREQILDLLVTTFEDAVRQNHELRRREEEISRAGERLAGMYEIVVALNHCTTEQEILDTALNGAIRLPRIRAAWISLVEPGGGLRLGAARNLPPSLAAPDAFDGDCRCRRLLRAGDLGSVTNILECERIARAGPGAQAIRYHASVPLHCGGEPLGVMNLLGETDELFDQGGRAVLYGIGSQIGFVIERARMWQRLEERVEERTRALQDSEERYRMLVTEVNDGIFVADEEGVITFANPALARIHGVDSPAELEGRSFAGFLAPEAKAEHLAFFHSFTVEGDAASLLTMPIVRPDGTRAIIEIRPVLVMQAGRVVGSRGVIRDVTERVRADEALQLSDSILRRIGNLVLVADGDGMIKYVSPSVEAGLGYRPDELLGDGWWRLAWEDLEGGERERMKVARLARDASLPNVPPVERAVRARDGSTHWILWQESKGSEGLFIGVGHDITERKKLQEQFLQAQKMEAVGRLAGGIAHDFNNVLTSILITTDLLLPGLSEDTVREDVLAIRVAAKRAAALTRQLLAFSRKQVLKPKVVSLNDLVAGMEDMLRSLLGEDIAIETLLAPGLGNAQIDPSQMEQVIMNLAVNARDAMPRGGRLIMETRSVDLGSEYVQAHPEARPGPHVVLSVTDSGTGMGPETMQLIFEPFFTTKGVCKGTGLGLATVHGIVNQSGGHISVYSEPGRGTTFKVYLPRIEAPADMAQGAEAVQALQGGSETILLVEDDDTVRRAADRVLRRGGYDVLATAGSDEALALLSTLDRRLHLLITDVVMPGLTGPELAERLARAQPGLRVLFVSGYSDEMTARLGRAWAPLPREAVHGGHATKAGPGGAGLSCHRRAAPRSSRSRRALMATNPDHRRRAGHSEGASARPGGAGPHGGGGRGRSDRAAHFAGHPTDVILTDIYMPQMDGIELIMRVKEAFPEARIVAMSGGGGLAKENVLGAAAKLGAEVVLEKPFHCGPGGRGHRGGDEGVLIAMRRPTAALLLLALAACGRAPEPAVRSVTLDRGWRFHGTADSTWLLASVRRTVHTDLLDAGRIRDPLTGDRERELRWIEDEASTYRLDFDVDDETLREERVDLVFEGLDTWASVTLNGHPLTLELRWVRRMMSCHRGPLLSASLLRCPRNRVNSRSYPT